jgi:hypothetical protein
MRTFAAAAVKGRAAVAADGSFSLTATRRDRAPEEAGLRRVGRVTVSGRSYFGLTGQTRRPHAFVLHVDAAARRVQAAAFDYAADCGGRVRERQNITPGGAIGPNGGFSLAERFTLRFSDATERYRVKVTGRFTPNGVAGTLSVTSVARSRAGAVIERCRTGAVAFAGAL